MQIRNNQGELVGEINTAFTGTGEVIVTNTTYDRGNPVFQTISVRDNQGQVPCCLTQQCYRTKLPVTCPFSLY